MKEVKLSSEQMLSQVCSQKTRFKKKSLSLKRSSISISLDLNKSNHIAAR